MISHNQPQSSSQIPPAIAARFWRAIMSRDPRADGTFFLAVRSTRIYCRPSCPARRPLRRNVIFFKTSQEAEQHGFRACLRCKPNQLAGPVLLVERAARMLAQSGDEAMPLSSLAAQAGTTPGILRRAVLQVTGLRPRELAEALRLTRFKKWLRSGLSITDALYATGYGSSRRVYEHSNENLGMTPAAYRKGGMNMNIGYAITNSALGPMLVAATSRGVSAVYLGDSETKLVQDLKSEYPNAQISRADHSFERWVKEIVHRVEGKPPRVELPMDLQATAFQRRVWQELQQIPRGTTKTYTQVARALGNPKAVRAVARACATNPVSIIVPCHRVIRQDGSLAGYRWGLGRKERLLENERAAGG